RSDTFSSFRSYRTGLFCFQPNICCHARSQHVEPFVERDLDSEDLLAALFGSLHVVGSELRLSGNKADVPGEGFAGETVKGDRHLLSDLDVQMILRDISADPEMAGVQHRQN